METWHSGQVWIARGALRFYGLKFGTVMTAIRLGDGGLFVHSPLALDPTLKAEIDALGRVRFVVSPNKLHHLFLGDFQRAYPEAKTYAPPGLAKKRPDLSFDGALGDAPEPEWAAEIDQCIFRGSRVMEEVVFFHRGSKSLILGDLLENFGPDDAPLTRIATRLAGMYGKPSVPTDWRFTVRDKETARRAVERILAWDFERIILAHGRAVESGGKDAFARAFAWLKPG